MRDLDEDLSKARCRQRFEIGLGPLAVVKLPENPPNGADRCPQESLSGEVFSQGRRA